MHEQAETDYPRRAVILAAGRGLRQKPYTDHTPKPLLTVRGRPTLDYVLDALAAAGVFEVLLVTGHLAERIENYVGDGRAWGMRASYRRQEKLLGTAHALRAARSFITDACFVVAADYVLPADSLLKLARAYVKTGNPLAVALKQLPAEELDRRSSVRFFPDGQIAEIVEKPAAGSAHSSVGASLIFIVNPAILPYLERLPLTVRGEYELQDAINRMLADGYKITGLLGPAPDEWQPSGHG